MRTSSLLRRSVLGDSVVVALGLVTLGCAQGSSPGLDGTGRVVADAGGAPPRAGATTRAPATPGEGSPPRDVESGAPQDGEPSAPSTPAVVKTEVNGAVAGATLAAKEAVAITYGAAVPAEAGDRLAIWIHDRTGFCADFGAGHDRAGATALMLVLFPQAGVEGFSTGTFAVGAGAKYELQAKFLKQESTPKASAGCSNTVGGSAGEASSGTLTIDTMSDVQVAGSFDLTFPGGGHLSGSFGSSVCTTSGAAKFDCAP